jgi:hypothetical protein
MYGRVLLVTGLGAHALARAGAFGRNECKLVDTNSLRISGADRPPGVSDAMWEEYVLSMRNHFRISHTRGFWRDRVSFYTTGFRGAYIEEYYWRPVDVTHCNLYGICQTVEDAQVADTVEPKRHITCELPEWL